MRRKLLCVSSTDDLKYGQVYYSDKEDYEYFYPEGILGGYYKHRFQVIPEGEEPKQSNNKELLERIEFLEAKMHQLDDNLRSALRQFQDQLDNHNHKDDIDFTVETETK